MRKSPGVPNSDEKPTLVFLGTAHYHPRGDRLVRDALREIEIGKAKPPKFIAVEAAANTYRNFKVRRDHALEELRKIECDAELASRVLAVALHEMTVSVDWAERTPGVEVVWLLSGHPTDDTPDAADRAIGKMCRYVSTYTDLNPDGTLAIMEAHAEDIQFLHRDRDADSFPDPRLREPYMCNSLRVATARLCQGPDDHGIVIIGSGHLSDRPGSLYDLAKEFADREREWCVEG